MGKIVSQETRDKLSKIHAEKRFSRKTEFKNGHIGAKTLAKLDWIKVQQIRNKWISNIYSYAELALEYGVSRSTIYFIVKNRTWKA